MVSIIDIKESTSGYEDCNTNHILIFGGYVKVRELLYTRVIIQVNAILNHIGILKKGCICLGMKVFA